MRSQRINSMVKGNGRMVIPQQAVYELKHRVILSLNKLADRDTFQIGSDELEKIAGGLTPEGILPFLSCVIDTDSEQKSAVRKECIKALGTLAKFHGSLMSAYIGKMAAGITKRLKDTDSAVRDACVEAAGCLTMTIGSSGENGFVALVKPFFEALGEQNRYVQTGSALCLARIIDEASEPPIPLLAQMLARVVKLLKNQHFMAKPAVIELIGSIVQAGGASAENTLILAVTGITEALKCNDWTTRKAAVLALARISGNAGPALGSLKSSCIFALESCRFDKVKPVRDAVVHALQCWKTISGTDSPASSETGSSTIDNINGNYSDLICTSDGRNLCSKSNPAVPALSGNSSTSAKNRAPLTTRKHCPNQMYDFQHKDSKEWHTEVSIPKIHKHTLADDPHKEQQRLAHQKEYLRNENTTSWYEKRERDTVKEGKKDSSNMPNFLGGKCDTKHVASNNEYLDDCNSANVVSIDSGPPTEEIDSEGLRILECNSVESTVIEEGLGGCCLHVSTELSFIKMQLLDIKNKQSKLQNILEVFMGNTTSSLSALHLKVDSLEHAVDAISQIVAHNGRSFKVSDHKNLKKIQSDSSSPKLSACTPRPSFDYKPHSALSYNRAQLCKEKSESNSSTKEGFDPTANKMNRNADEIDFLKTTGRNQVNESDNLFSIPTSTVCFKNENSEDEAAVSWKKINNRLCAGDVESAYKMALSSGDSVTLFELMNRTGPVLEKLSNEVATKVLTILSKKFLNHSFLPSVIPWLQQLVDLCRFQEPKQRFLSERAEIEFLYALQCMSDVEYIDQKDKISLSYFVSKLRKIWGENTNRINLQSKGHTNGSIKLMRQSAKN